MQTENHYTETDLGNISPNPRGDYDNAARYEFLDLVTMQGGSYLCVIPVGQTITGTAPESGKNTEHWQCLAMPGDMTLQYTEAHDKVVRLAQKVAQDATKVAEDKQSVAQIQTDVRQLKEQAEESARQAENSKDSAAGSARAAKTAEDNAKQAASNVNALVNGFDTHVAEKTTEATQAVATVKDNAVQAVGRQETASVQEVKDQTSTYIIEQKNLAKQELDKKVDQFGIDVNAIKIEVAKEGTKQVGIVQDATTTELAKITEKGTEQTEAVAKEGEKQVQAVQVAAQEIIADREQIAKNKTDIADLRQNKADAIVETVSGTLLNVKDSAHAKIVNLKINKNVDWLKVTGKNLLDVQGEKIGHNINLMEIGIGRIKYTTQDDYGGGYVKFSKTFEAGEYVYSSKITKDGIVDSGIRLGFSKEVSIKNNQLLYNSYYEMYFMRDYSDEIQITASEPFTIMISINSKSATKGSLIEMTDIQLERGTVNTLYEPYRKEQNVIAPITEDKLNTLHTNYPTTIISNSENAEMQLTYVADTKNYHLGREEILQKQILEIQNALISQKISGGGYKGN